MTCCATPITLFLLSLATVQGHNTPVPRPVITLHSGHIGLYDRLLQTQFNGVVQTGEPYTLEIYMGNTDEYDYMIESCVFNQRLTFMDEFGCLRKTAFFVDRLEVDQYNRPGALKRTLIHFFADQPILNFECQVKVIHCSGCAEQSCERRPLYDSYPTSTMQLQCCGNYPPPYIPPPAPPPVPPAPFPQRDDWWHRDWLWGLPWYWWIIIFILILLLLCCIICLIGCCFWRGRRKRRDSQYSSRSYSPPPPAPHSNRIYTVDGAVQTMPERRQAAQQVDQLDMRESYSRTNYVTHPQPEYAYNLRQVDNHASIDLHPEAARRPSSAAAYTNHVYDGDFYEEDRHERAFTKYDNHKAPKYNRGTPVAHTIPIRRTSSSHTSQEERRLQRELEEHLRHHPNYHDRSDEFIERIEEQLRSQHYHQQQRHHDPEAFREETVRTMHQSSVI